MEPMTVVSPDRYEEALCCLVGRRRTTLMKSMMEQLTAAGRLPEGCLRAVLAVDGGFLAVSYMAVAPGRTVTITLSPARGRAGAERCEMLLTDSCAALVDWQVDLAQTLLGPGDAVMLDVYLRSGFTHLADLQTMTLAVRRSGKRKPMPAGVTLCAATDEMLPEILDETYIGTQDCPGLHGLRRTEDIVVGHRAGGRVVPELWQTILLDSVPVGCVLMTCGADKVADLAYIGLCPDARGKGIGIAVLSHMMGRLSAKGVRMLRLAVDASNVPARKVYHRMGFRHSNTQRAVIRSTRRMQVEPASGQDVHMTSTPRRSCGG